MDTADSRTARRPAPPYTAVPQPHRRSPTGDPIDLERLERLRTLTWWLDSRWRVPGTNIPIGIDGVASIVPGVGDTATALISAYIVYEAARFGLPKHLLLRMAANVGIDWIVGSIPVLGTLFDIGFKANRRNLNLLHRHLEERLGGTAP